ncbi:MAG TPA: PsiF family protein [Steroidobacteraceae bacterium]|nr:PsiF family protein [Steroidobacteraceae bacterium]
MYARSLIAIVSAMLILSAPVHAGEQQDKMKTCNAEASQKQLKGDDRKAFMKTCLSAKHEAAPVSQQEKMKACNSDAGSKGLKGDERKKFMSQCLSNKPAA